MEEMNSLKKTARIAGLFFLLTAVTGGFSVVYIRSKLIVSTDAWATANNIMAHESLFRLGIVGNLVSQFFLLFFGLMLFRLFSRVNKTWATLCLLSIVASVTVAVFNSLNRVAALLVLSKANYLSAFSQEQLNAIMMLFLRLNNSGLGLSELCLAPYIFSFGLLIIKSRFIPKIFGVLLVISSVGFPVNTFTKLLIPDFYPAMFTQFAMFCGAIGGIPIMLWLLIKGVKDEQRISDA